MLFSSDTELKNSKTRDYYFNLVDLTFLLKTIVNPQKFNQSTNLDPMLIQRLVVKT